MSAVLVLGAFLLTAAGCGSSTPAMSPAELARVGEEIYKRYACNACHSLNGNRRLPGPDLSGIALRRTPDDIRGKLLNPEKDTVQGFPRGLMPARIGEKMPAQDIAVLVAFLSTMKGQNLTSSL